MLNIFVIYWVEDGKPCLFLANTKLTSHVLTLSVTLCTMYSLPYILLLPLHMMHFDLAIFSNFSTVECPKLYH